MKAIVLAGGPPFSVPARSTGSAPLRFEKKALLPIAGAPMIAWVLSALAESGLVDEVVIVGLRASDLDGVDLPKEVAAFVPDQGPMLENLLAGRDALSSAVGYGLVAMADTPLLTADGVRRFVAQCGDRSADLYFPAVERRQMSERFPGARRTYFPGRDGDYTGGNLLGLRLDREPPEEVRGLIHARKSVLRTAWLLGPGLLLRIFLRRLRLEGAATRVGRRLGIRAVAVRSEDPEIAMDVDRPHQVGLVERALRAREARSGAP